MDMIIQSTERKKLNQEHAEACIQDFGKIKEGKRTLIFRMDFPETMEEGQSIEAQFMGCPMNLAELQAVMTIFGKSMMEGTGISGVFND